MDALHAYLNSLDATGWLILIFGTAFLILLLRYLYTRINVGDTSANSRPLELSVLFSGLAWGALQFYDWSLPVLSSAYFLNSSNASYVVQAGDARFCLPGKSFYFMSWRLDPPTDVTVIGPDGSKAVDHIGRGEWFVNASPDLVSIDLIDYQTKSINPDALAIQDQGSLRVNVGQEKPFQLYSQLPLDRDSFGSGDIVDRHLSAPCPPPPP